MQHTYYIRNTAVSSKYHTYLEHLAGNCLAKNTNNFVGVYVARTQQAMGKMLGIRRV